jgi:hypothetical protein
MKIKSSESPASIGLEIIGVDGQAQKNLPEGDSLSQEEQKSFDHTAHAPNVLHDLADHVLLSLLGVVLIGFALATAMITHYATSTTPAYFSENMAKAATLAEWAILVGGVATTIGLAAGLTISSAINLIEKLVLNWRNLVRVWKNDN